MKEPTQRTGSFTAAAHLRPRDTATQLQAVFQQIDSHLQKATDDKRAYTIEIRIVANITVEPWQAEIGEYVHPDYFQPGQTENQTLGGPSLAIEKRVFQPTRQGFQRIE